MLPLNHCQKAVRCEHYLCTVARHCRIVHSHGPPIRNSLHMSSIKYCLPRKTQNISSESHFPEEKQIYIKFAVYSRKT